MNFPIVSRLLGFVMIILALAFGLCLGVSFALDDATHSTRSIAGFIIATLASLAIGGALLWAGRYHSAKFFKKEALAAIGLSWLLASAVGAIPYMVITPEAGITGAIFETASGLTTTGASVLSNLEDLPPSLLFWRSLSQWIGGMGVVVFFVAILGFLGAGGKILYANEASGSVAEFEESRVQSTVSRLVYIYLGLSGACFLCFWAAGMNWFDAVNHTFTTLSTGGFSTRSASLAAFESPLIEWIAIVFMMAGGVNFLLILRLVSGRANYAKRNTELLAYLALTAMATLIIALALYLDGTLSSPHEAIRGAAFQFVSILTTTGFATHDFAQWSALPLAILLMAMVAGGCTGSTAGGVKISRIVIALRLSILSVERSFRSRVVRQVRINNRPLSEQATQEVINYLVLVGFVALASIVVVSIFEPQLQLDTNLSIVPACFFNIGPGFAEVGPTETFAFLHPYTKLYLTFLMIMGRLELYAILALFAPSLWKRFS